MLTHIDLFSGLGGFALAAQWAGFRTVAFCENETFCQEVLKKHWPGVPIHSDIRTFHWTGEQPTLLTGGFPCQDISQSGKKAGIKGNRSGLWEEMLRVICEIRPKYILVENVSALLERGIDRVLGDLAESGFDAEWDCFPAGIFGAPHVRDRVYLLAYANGQRCDNTQERRSTIRLPKCLSPYSAWISELSESAICRENDGVPRRVHRLKALGNAIVPQVAYQIIKEIARIENDK